MKPLNLIALLLFIASTVWVLTLGETTVRSIQKTFYSVISPFIRGGATLETTAAEFIQEAEHSKIWEERYKLAKADLDQTRMEIAHLRKIEIENAELNKALSFKQNEPFQVLPAKIIRRQPSTWWQTVTINLGENNNIGVQLPVLSAEGLVGKIDTTSPNTSTVLLLTDESCQVSAKIDGTPEVGILSGIRGRTGESPLLRLNYLSKGASIEPGMMVYTTGRGGLFPEGILLGTIESYESGPLSGEALVKPAVDFKTLKIVFVKHTNPLDSPRLPEK